MGLFEMTGKICVKLFVIVFCLSLLAPLGLSQDRGSVSGTITDASGAVVPGAVVTLRNPATGFSQNFASLANGEFSFQSLPAGEYTLTIEKPGFRKMERSSVTVAVDTNTRVDSALEIGQVQEITVVQGTATLLQTDRTDLGQVIENRAIESLPLFSSGGMRSNMAFALLVPGVRTDLSQDVDEGGSPIIGGGTGGSNTSFRVDGGETESPRRNEPQVRVVSVEGVEEFKVQVSAYSAEYGRTSNGILNYTTKSGTNEFQGSLLVQLRNQALNANGFFYTAPAPGEQTVHNQNTEAASFGGPIRIPKVYNGRNKAFFFFSGERSRAKDIISSALESVPTAAARAGDFSAYTGTNGKMIPIYNPFDASGNVLANANLRVPFPGNIIPQSMINPVAAALISYEPLPQNPNSFLNNNPVINTGQRDPGENEGVYSIKGDYIPSEKMRFNGLFTRQYFNGCNICLGPMPGPEGEGFQENYDNRYTHFNMDYVFTPTLLNHFSFNFDQRIGEQLPNIRLGPNTGAYGTATEIPGVPTYLQSPLYASYDTQNFENFNTTKYDHLGGNNVGLNESLAWVKGKHSVKFGFQYLSQDWYNNFCNTCGGVATFTSAATGNPSVSGTTGSDLASLLLGVAATGGFAYYSNPDSIYPYYAWYVQDDIKLSRKLTVNLGLRYDLPLAKRVAGDQYSLFDPNIPNPGAGNLLGALIFAGSGPGRSGLHALLSHRTLAFGPRAGAAYNITPTTVIRAGGAIYYDSNKEDGSSLDSLTGFGGSYTTPANYFSTGISMLLPNGSNSAIAGLNPFQGPALAIKPVIIDPTLSNYQSPSAYSDGRVGQYYDYNFTVEQSIKAATLFRASFHASYGNEIRSTQQYNQLNPKYIPIYGNLLTQPLSSLISSNGTITNPVLIANGYQLPYAGYPLIETLANSLEPYPQYQSISETTNGGHSTYNALESGLTHKFTNGFFAQVSYTFSKWLSDNTSPNVFAVNREKDLNGSDRTHILAISYVYELPFGRGKRFGPNMNPAVNSVLGGWRGSVVQQYQSGAPIGVTCGQTLYGAGVARCSLVPGVPLINPNWNPSVGTSSYLNPAAFYQPANGVFGTTGVYIPSIRNPWQLNEDVAVSKIFPLSGDKRTLEFRASAYNAANRHLLGSIGATVGSSTFGQFSNPQSNLPRNVEFALRFKF
jgi:Carboxypeptidase regulatory-like domain